MRAYNLTELFKFITEDLQMYLQRKLLALAFCKTENLHLAPRWFGATGSKKSNSVLSNKALLTL